QHTIPLHPSVHLCPFHCPRHPPHLPSFPTRRSSDLIRPLPHTGTVQRIQIVFDEGYLTPTTTFPLPFVNTGGGPDEFGAAILDKDRKSTRLNSSHLVISYAVFCLKKKT